jgi:hypothetical protein
VTPSIAATIVVVVRTFLILDIRASFVLDRPMRSHGEERRRGR